MANDKCDVRHGRQDQCTNGFITGVIAVKYRDTTIITVLFASTVQSALLIDIVDDIGRIVLTNKRQKLSFVYF